ncbi:MAG TPA: hypothetical protein VHW26_06630 [Solirubrobacteraceae bacterium]|nr:hypothetical protein [Solirubrobacteraceae bacterium]
MRDAGRSDLRARVRVVLGVLALGLPLVAFPPPASADGWTGSARVTPADLDVAGGAAATTSTGDTVMALETAGDDSRGPLDLEVMPAGSTSPGSVTQLSPGNAFGPTVVTDGEGDAYVSWLQQDLSGPAVVERIADGTIDADLGLPDDAAWPTLAADTAGAAAAVWESTAGPAASLELALKPAGSKTFGAPIDLTGPLQPGSATLYPKLAVDGDGTTVVAWLAPGSATGTTQLATAIVAPDGAVTLGSLTAGETNVDDLQLVGTDAGVLATWAESPVGESAGALRAATEPDRASFGAAFEIGGGADGTLVGGAIDPVVAAAPGGHVLVAWTTAQPDAYDPGAASGGPVVTADGEIATGRFTTPSPLFTTSTYVAYTPTGAVLGADGSAVVALASGTVAQRTATGPFVLAQAACGDTSPLVVGLASGEASMLWRDPSSIADTRSVFLTTEDQAAAPLVCPTRPQAVVVTPADAVTGQPVEIDATGMTDATADTNAWAWEIDGDGSQLGAYADDPIQTVTFSTPGVHYVYVLHRVTDPRGDVVDGGSTLEINVYTPDTVPNVVHRPSWVGTAASAPVASIAGSTAPPAAAVVPRQLSASIPAGQKLRAALRRGLAIRVESPTARRVTIALTVNGRRVGRIAARLAAGRIRTVRVPVGLSGRTRRATTVDVAVDGAAVRVRCVTVLH